MQIPGHKYVETRTYGITIADFRICKIIHTDVKKKSNKTKEFFEPG